jgi:hypothetical protein
MPKPTGRELEVAARVLVALASANDTPSVEYIPLMEAAKIAALRALLMRSDE